MVQKCPEVLLQVQTPCFHLAHTILETNTKCSVEWMILQCNGSCLGLLQIWNAFTASVREEVQLRILFYCTIFFCLPKQDQIGISESKTCLLVAIAHSITAQSHYFRTIFSLIGFLKTKFVSENIDTGEVGGQWRTCSECPSPQPALLTVQCFSHLFHLPWLGLSSPAPATAGYCYLWLSNTSYSDE